MTTVSVAVYEAPASPEDIAVVTAIVVAADLIGLALLLLWKRVTRKRRQYRNSG